MITVGVVGALLVGLWLDAQFGLRGPFTIGLVVLSAPVSLYLVLRLVLRLLAEVQPPKTKPTDTDATNGGGHL